MSKDIIVLAPNGRRQTVKCSLNTTVLQILEEVCKKQGFDSSQYDLTHHSKVLDPSIPIRFSNLPNRATLEMVEAACRREDNNVTIALQLQNDERHICEFKPQTNLYTVVEKLASSELSACQNPTVVYMRHEVHGVEKLRTTTLRQMGLMGGRAVLRLIDKSLEELKMQANVSSTLVPRLPIKEDSLPSVNKVSVTVPEPNSTTSKLNTETSPVIKPISEATASHIQQRFWGINPIKLIKDEIKVSTNGNAIEELEETNRGDEESMEVDETGLKCLNEPIVEIKDLWDDEQLQRRLNIEQEVTILGNNKAIAFVQSSDEPQLAELPDEFYELTVNEVRRLYRDLKRGVTNAAEAPLLTAQQRATQDAQRVTERGYKHAVVRVQFPDRMILQGVFDPTDTIQQVYDFTRQYLVDRHRLFHLYTTPSRETLEPAQSLESARMVPGVLLHFRWADGEADVGRCLLERVYSGATPSDAAAILASKYRAPSRRKLDTAAERGGGGASTSGHGKVPKWFKVNI